jgi:predicted GIY-YIG superfamily endonuclease
MSSSDLTRQQAKAGRTELYRHFDKDDRLLYVGISLSTAHRLAEHRCVSGWSSKVVKITIERFPTRKAALEAERNAIQAEAPIHNVTGKKRGLRVSPSPTLHLTASDPDPRETPLAKYFRERGYKVPA